MKYLKLFESFFEMNELVGHLIEIAKKLIQNLPEQEAELSMNEYKIKVSLKSNLDDTVREFKAEIYQNENRIATIFIDFEPSEFPNNIVVCYDLNMTNEGRIISNYMPKGVF